MQTQRELLYTARNQLSETSASAEVDASVLLSHVLGVNRAVFHTWPERAVRDEDAQLFLNLVARRCQGEPIAYLIGHREFWTLDLMVTPDCLIPRPETELLVECALNLLPEKTVCRIADVGTGSGAIALALKSSRPHWHIWAGDVSPEALVLAKKNANALNLTQIEWLECAYLQSFPNALHAVLSNPPYIAKTDVHLQQGDCRFEPHLALVAEEDGYAALISIAKAARTHLQAGGFLMMEHGAEQGPKLRGMLETFGYKKVLIHSDLAGHGRVTTAVWP